MAGGAGGEDGVGEALGRGRGVVQDFAGAEPAVECAVEEEEAVAVAAAGVGVGEGGGGREEEASSELGCG